MPLYNSLAYFGSGYLISELCPACLTGISGCFFSLVFLFACFSFFCSLWLAFQVLPGPCNLHRPGGIPRIALGKGGKKKFWHRELFHSDVQVNHFLLTTPYPCVTCTYPVLSSFLSSTPPRHEYILNGTWRSHRNLPCGLSLQVYTQYPRPEVFPMTSSLPCMRLPL